MHSARPVSVLVVDDDPDTVESTATVLTLHGFRAIVAHGGREALDAAAADPPDVALIDLGMPGVDGYEVARRLRAGHTGRPPILIAVTALGHAWGGPPAQAAGFHLYLTKPVPPAELIAVLWQCDQARQWGDVRDECPTARY
jgi:two-component system, OmpR family, response regulator